MVNVELLKKFVEDNWEGDFDIEIEHEEMPTKILIFWLGNDSYWTYNPSQWHFSGKRYLIKADEDYYPKYTNFQNRMEKTGIYDVPLNLEDALKLVEFVFGSKKTKYGDIQELAEEIKSR